MAYGTLLQLDPTGLVVTPVTPGASLGQLPQSRQAFRELVLARVSVTIARSRLWLQPHDSQEHRIGNGEQAPEPSDRVTRKQSEQSRSGTSITAVTVS